MPSKFSKISLKLFDSEPSLISIKEENLLEISSAISTPTPSIPNEVNKLLKDFFF